MNAKQLHDSKISEFLGQKDLVTVDPAKPVRVAIDLMRENNVGSVLVVSGEALVGIFTLRDVERLDLGSAKAEKMAVEEAMTPDPDTVAPGATAAAALNLMVEGGYRHLPVVEAGRLMGIVSRRDFFGDLPNPE